MDYWSNGVQIAQEEHFGSRITIIQHSKNPLSAWEIDWFPKKFAILCKTLIVILSTHDNHCPQSTWWMFAVFWFTSVTFVEPLTSLLKDFIMNLNIAFVIIKINIKFMAQWAVEARVLFHSFLYGLIKRIWRMPHHRQPHQLQSSAKRTFYQAPLSLQEPNPGELIW